MKKVFKIGCFSILVVFVGLFIIGLFLSEQDNIPSPKEQSDTPIVEPTIKKIEPSAEKADSVVDTLITTPQEANRVAKEMDWFATPESQNLKVGDFIMVTGHPIGYIGAMTEPFGDEHFPTFKLVYRESCHNFFLEHWIYPAQGEICDIWIKGDSDFSKIRSVREYNLARQSLMEDYDWLKHRGLTLIVQIEKFDYSLYNEEVGNKWSIEAVYTPGDMLRY